MEITLYLRKSGNEPIALTVRLYRPDDRNFTIDLGDDEFFVEKEELQLFARAVEGALNVEPKGWGR